MLHLFQTNNFEFLEGLHCVVLFCAGQLAQVHSPKGARSQRSYQTEICKTIVLLVSIRVFDGSDHCGSEVSVSIYSTGFEQAPRRLKFSDDDGTLSPQRLN